MRNLILSGDPLSDMAQNLSDWTFRLSGPVFSSLIIMGIVAIFVIIKHRGNIKRLMNGTENGFGKKRKKA